LLPVSPPKLSLPRGLLLLPDHLYGEITEKGRITSSEVNWENVCKLEVRPTLKRWRVLTIFPVRSIFRTFKMASSSSGTLSNPPPSIEASVVFSTLKLLLSLCHLIPSQTHLVMHCSPPSTPAAAAAAAGSTERCW
jgi:hypothetical protein